MSAVASQAQPGFRIEMLWRDERYRGGFIQAVTMILVVLAISWLANNVITNLANLGKPFTFDFLWQPSNYDINQQLVSYTSQSTHARAALVGILNTLVIAIVGCATALTIGVFVGVLRLSNNWLVARLMTVYVETLRNVPVLLWILLIATIIINTFPVPNAYKGVETGAIIPTNRGLYVPKPVWADGTSTLLIIVALCIAAAFLFRAWAHRRQEATGDHLPVFWIGLGIITLPSVIAYFLLGRPVTLDYPTFQRFNFQGGFQLRESFVSLWLALSLYTGAFIAETVRAGIQSVSRGQTEAAFALGLPPGRTMNLVILPQALRVIIPPLISQFLNLTKNSSLAIAVTYMDVTGTLGGITMNQTGREMECILLLMLFYLLVSLTVSTVMNWYNTRVKLVER